MESSTTGTYKKDIKKKKKKKIILLGVVQLTGPEQVKALSIKGNLIKIDY